MSTWSEERRKLPWVTLSASEEEECRLWSIYEDAQVAADKAAKARNATLNGCVKAPTVAKVKRMQAAQKRSEKADEVMEAAWQAWDKYTSALAKVTRE